MSAELIERVKKILSELATAQKTSITNEEKSLFSDFLEDSTNEAYKDLWKVVFTLEDLNFSPDFTGKTLASYLWNESLLIKVRNSIKFKLIDGEVMSLVWQDFLALDSTVVDWSYLPQSEVSYDTEMELWTLWLARVPSPDIEGIDSQVYVNAFHLAGPRILRSIRKNLKKIDPKESESPVGCLNAFRKLFPALLYPPKPEDVSRAQEALTDLKSRLPYFDMDDVVFGKHYDFFDGQVQLKFNQLYTRVLINRLFLPSGHLVHSSETSFNQLYYLQKSGDLYSFLQDGKVVGPRHMKWIPLISEKQKLHVATNLFVRLIHSHAEKYDRGISGKQQPIYMAPMLALCNSSGVGKTRLVMSAASSFISILICLRESSLSSGYPPRSCVANYVLDSRVLNSSSKVMSFLLACLMAWIEVFQEWITIKTEIIDKYQQFYSSDEDNFLKIMGDLIALNEPTLKPIDVPDEKSFHEIYWQRVISLHEDPKNPIVPCAPTEAEASTGVPPPSEKYDDDRYERLVAELVYQIKSGKDEYERPESFDPYRKKFRILNETAKEALVKAGILASDDKALFLITFDEARYLLTSAEKYQDSILRHLRHGSRPLVGGFIILTDTLSQLSHISPPPRFDHSAKSNDGQAYFAPLTSFPLLDIVRCNVGKLEPVLEHAADGYSSLDYDPFVPVNMSRPMFPVYFNEITKGHETFKDYLETLPQVYSCAVTKFTGTVEVDSIDAAHPLLSAIWTCRLNARFVSFRTNSMIMASHLGLATYLSGDREVLTVTYQGEPMASLAAANAMYHTENRWFATITSLRRNLENGSMVIPDVGGVGELLVACYCLLARDHPFHEAIIKQPKSIEVFSRPQIVLTFLQCLLSSSQLWFLQNHRPEIAGELFNSFTTFTSFLTLSEPGAYLCSMKPVIKQLITKRVLLWALHSRVAFYLPPGTEGIGIVIPIIVGKKGSAPIKMSANNVGAIVVQAKRYSAYLTRSELLNIHSRIWKSKELFEDGIPILLGILMNVGRGGLGTEHETSKIKFSDENVWPESSFPIVSISSKSVQKSLDLPVPICHDLDEIVGLNPGAIDGIRRDYSDAKITDDEIQVTVRHMYPQSVAQLPPDFDEAMSSSSGSPIRPPSSEPVQINEAESKRAKLLGERGPDSDDDKGKSVIIE